MLSTECLQKGVVTFKTQRGSTPWESVTERENAFILYGIHQQKTKCSDPYQSFSLGQRYLSSVKYACQRSNLSRAQVIREKQPRWILDDPWGHRRDKVQPVTGVPARSRGSGALADSLLLNTPSHLRVHPSSPCPIYGYCQLKENIL